MIDDTQIEDAVELRAQMRKLLNRHTRVIRRREQELAQLRDERNLLIVQANLFLTPREIAGLCGLSQTFVREVLRG